MAITSIVTNNDIFISYSSKNEDVAKYIYKILRDEKGLVPWMANSNSIQDGKDFREAIMRGLDSTKMFLLLLSKESMNSRWVDLELTQAIHRNMKIFTLRLDDCVLTDLQDFKLGSNQTTDGVGNLDARIEALAMAIKEEKNILLEQQKHMLKSSVYLKEFSDLHWFFNTTVLFYSISSLLFFILSKIFYLPFDLPYNWEFVDIKSFFLRISIASLIMLILNIIMEWLYYSKISDYTKFKASSAFYVLYRFYSCIPFMKKTAEKNYKFALELNDRKCLELEIKKTVDEEKRQLLEERLDISIKQVRDRTYMVQFIILAVFNCLYLLFLHFNLLLMFL